MKEIENSFRCYVKSLKRYKKSNLKKETTIALPINPLGSIKNNNRRNGFGLGGCGG